MKDDGNISARFAPAPLIVVPKSDEIELSACDIWDEEAALDSRAVDHWLEATATATLIQTMIGLKRAESKNCALFSTRCGVFSRRKGEFMCEETTRRK